MSRRLESLDVKKTADEDGTPRGDDRTKTDGKTPATKSTNKTDNNKAVNGTAAG